MLNHTKYDETNQGTQYVFNNFYKKINDKKIDSTLVACPGKDVDRYIKYVSMVCQSPNTKAYFFENKDDHYELIEQKLRNSWDRTKLKIELVKGDITTYDSQLGIKPVRVEDIGIGSGMSRLTYEAALRLSRQSSKTHRNKKENSDGEYKVQILNMSLRWSSKERIFHLLSDIYLNVIETGIKSFNGIDPTKHLDLFTKVEHAEKVLSYEDKIGRNCNVYKHKIELNPSKRFNEVSLDMYTYVNGSNMLQTMLMYR